MSSELQDTRTTGATSTTSSSGGGGGGGGGSGSEMKQKKKRRLVKYRGETASVQTAATVVSSDGSEMLQPSPSASLVLQQPLISYHSNHHDSRGETPAMAVSTTVSNDNIDHNSNAATRTPTNDDAPPPISFLASRERGMAVIPPDQQDKDALGILKDMDRVLQKLSVQRALKAFVEAGHDPSARRIQAGRFEIFLEAHNKPSTAFDTIVAPQLNRGGTAKTIVLSYARRQARRDPRLHIPTDDHNNIQNNMAPISTSSSNNKRKQSRPVKKTGYKFGTFSIIVSFKAVQAQAPHIDLVPPNYQFGLLVSDQCPGTMVYETHARIQTIQDLVHLWNGIMKSQRDDDTSKRADDDETKPNPTNIHDVPTTTDKQQQVPASDVPAAIIQALENNEKALDLLKSFGDALPTDKQTSQSKQFKPNLPVGSCLSLPGGVVHAGPQCDKFRAVIFFSAVPCYQVDSQYDPDVQYTGLLLCGHLISMVWNRNGIGYNERLWLLRLLMVYVQESSVQGMWGHFGAGELSRFVRAIETKQYGPKCATIHDLVEQAARSTGIAVPGDPWSESENVVVVENMKLVSTKNLYTPFEGANYNVWVYRIISDGRIVLRYRQHTDDNNDEYEGMLPKDNFTLEFFQKSSIADTTTTSSNQEGEASTSTTDETLFDGMNGVVRASDGEVIKFFPGPVGKDTKPILS